VTIQEHPVWTTKDIARVLGPNVSERQVRDNERRWGLFEARIKLKTRSVLYCSQKVEVILKRAGVMQ